MPNLDGTGPIGQGAMTGWRMGRCRDTQAVKTAPEGTSGQTAETKEVVYGLGRSGQPRGGGFGFGGNFGYRFGGGSRRGQGRGRRFNG